MLVVQLIPTEKKQETARGFGLKINASIIVRESIFIVIQDTFGDQY